ncbi:hypothetical protein INT43_008560 [Umbelopsis isabellina]|uniref:beta-glucosidase n=1 Tax=Mortierella isabellina TaxID=91625 RepID=A0A8H7PVH4_MORIS|nr:hypothetical protein INT43_008560 [Umbelopsis isabellina]
MMLAPSTLAEACNQAGEQCGGVGFIGEQCCTRGHQCVATNKYTSVRLLRFLLGRTSKIRYIRDFSCAHHFHYSNANMTVKWDVAIQKSKALVDKMTLDEKINFATGVGWQEGACLGNIAAVPRLNFTGLCLQDSPAGIRFAKGVSVFPSGINTAATFDKDLIYERARIQGEEFRAKGVNVALSPMMNLLRSPWAGRNWEGAGEDPYLVGIAAGLSVSGIQSNGVIATAKHFVGNEQETNRVTYSSYISDRAMHELYLWPFRESVEAGVGSVMCAYNKVNGTYACENDKLLNGLLKGELNFKGFVQSDWSATMSSVPSALGGLDMTMPGDIQFHSKDSYFGKNLTSTIEKNEVPESRVHDMAVRILAAWFLHEQDQDYPEVNFDSWDMNPARYVDVQGSHGRTIREIGAASTILLKNEKNVLPLNYAKSLAVIGDDAGDNPGGPNACEDRGCDRGTLAIGWGSGTAEFPYLISPFDGINSRAARNVKVLHSLDDYDYDYASQIAAEVEVPIVFANADSGEEFVTVEENVGDRQHLQLWHNTEKLIKAVADANDKTVVVIHSVGPVDMAWADHPNISAIVWAGLPGQESGNSLADVLFGDVNPSGRLPYTIAKSVSDYPVRIEKSKEIRYTEDLNIGYRYFENKNIQPKYEFGYGLSYTRFNYSKAQIEQVGDDIKVTVHLQNIGDYDGAEVPQLYLEFPNEAEQPSKILRGFEKVFMKSGHSGKAEFILNDKLLSYWNVVKQAWVVPSGNFTVHIGASSRDIRFKQTFII